MPKPIGSGVRSVILVNSRSYSGSRGIDMDKGSLLSENAALSVAQSLSDKTRNASVMMIVFSKCICSM